MNDKQVNVRGHWDGTPKIDGGEETWGRGFSMRMKVTPLYGVTQRAMAQLMRNRGVSATRDGRENRAQTRASLHLHVKTAPEMSVTV